MSVNTDITRNVVMLAKLEENRLFHSIIRSEIVKKGA